MERLTFTFYRIICESDLYSSSEEPSHHLLLPLVMVPLSQTAHYWPQKMPGVKSGIEDAGINNGDSGNVSTYLPIKHHFIAFSVFYDIV